MFRQRVHRLTVYTLFEGTSGVAVTSEGTDAGQAAPMEEQVVRRTDQHPDSYLMDGMDGGFATREDITTLEQRAVTVYAPVRLPRNRPEQER